MKVPTELFIKGITEKKVYYFSSTQINTDIPHYFICIKRTDEDVLILSCCTSQFDTVKSFVESRNLPFETLVYITPADEINPFDKQTFVNCNEYFEYSVDDFRSKYETDSISFSGAISDGHYEQILIGIHASPLIAPEVKELIPQPLQ